MKRSRRGSIGKWKRSRKRGGVEDERRKGIGRKREEEEDKERQEREEEKEE